MDNEAELIKAVLNGNLDAFEPLVLHYQPRIFATARRYAKSEAEAQDIVQEIFVKAFQKLDTFRAEAPFEHWLMRLAVRVCYDFLRVRKKSREFSLADITEDDVALMEHIAAGQPDSNESALAAKELVERALQHLSPESRLVITLLEIEERPVKEISQLTGWSVSLVKVRAFRARREMRKFLERLMRSRKL
jgi:RNA polymerase sigma-70 factor (ECF subfamily)